MTYEEACERGYDGPPPGWRPKTYNCSDGFCGAYDCYTCRGPAAYECDEEENDVDEDEEEIADCGHPDAFRQCTGVCFACIARPVVLGGKV